MRALRSICFMLLCLLPRSQAWADDVLVVIAHPGSAVQQLQRSEGVNLFLGRYKTLPGGMRATPLDTEELRAQFYKLLVNKTLPEINAYWTRLTFSGQTLPPRRLRELQVLETVATTPGAIGYVRREIADARVRIVFELTP